MKPKHVHDRIKLNRTKSSRIEWLFCSFSPEEVILILCFADYAGQIGFQHENKFDANEESRFSFELQH